MCQRMQVLHCKDGKPTYLHFSKANGWKEVVEYRNLRSALPWALELVQVGNEFALAPLAQTLRTGIFLGTAKDKKTRTLLVRTVSPAVLALDTFEQLLSQELRQSFDTIERANLDPQVDSQKPMSHIFLHFVT